MKRATYSHPLYKNEVHKFLHADHVTDEKGTGLVHCAPSHGREDYIVAVENNLKLVGANGVLHAFFFACRWMLYILNDSL